MFINDLGLETNFRVVKHPVAMLTWLLEELQKKYSILKSSEFNFLKGRHG